MSSSDSNHLHSCTDVVAQDGSDFSDLEDDKRTTIKEKYRLFQSILVIVQNILGEVADMEEGIRK